MSPPIRIIEPWELRALFNDSGLWDLAKAGELREEVKRNGHPSPPLAEEPECTRSQIVYYFDSQDVKVAVVHQYLRPDGSIGLSGRPDPQAMLVDGVILIPRKDPPRDLTTPGAVGRPPP